MKLFAQLTTLALAAVGAVAECNISPRPVASRPKGLVCDKLGSVPRTQKYLLAQFFADTYKSCNSRCVSSGICNSAGYNTQSGECRHYTDDLTKIGFKANATSVYKYADVDCYLSEVDCALQNPSFEDADVAGNITLYSTGYAPPRHQIYLAPWTATTAGTSTAHVVTGSAALPASNGSKFANITVIRADTVEFIAYQRLQPRSTYRFSIDYAYLAYNGNRNFAYPQYGLGTFFRSTPIADTTLNIQNGDDDGQWKTLSGEFQVPAGTIYGQPLGVRVSSPSAMKGSPKSAVFGLDNFVLEKVA